MALDTGFDRPTLAEIITRVESDFNTRIPGADSRLRRSMLSALGRVLSGASHSAHGYLDFIARQAIIDTATSEYLRRWAAVWGVTPTPATKATGSVSISGTPGTAVNKGTRLQRGDGVIYVTTLAVVLSGGGTATPTVEALEAGVAGNAPVFTVLSFVSPISGVTVTGSTLTGFTGGADAETDDSLRERLLERIQNPPHGGAENDYRKWALEVPGVTRAWVYPGELGAGTVSVRFMMDATYVNGIPQAGDVAAVQAYLAPKRPITAAVTVTAPIPVTRNFTILLKDANGATVTSPTVRAAVTAELADMILRDGKPGFPLRLSRIREAISIAAGEFDHNISVPNADVTYATGEIPVMGTITWL